MANINKIRLSGQTYNIQDQNATKTLELTQAQYDALSVKDPNTFYIITDAQGADLSQYYTSAQTESAITQAVSGKQDTLISGTNIKTINNESLLGSGNINIQGGGKAIEAGRGISVTTGETADTVSFNLPIYSGGTKSIKIGEDNGTLSGFYNLSVGTRNSITGENSIVVGADNNGRSTQYSAIFGYNNTIENYKNYCVVGGMFNKLKNPYETSFGNSSSTKINSYSFGDSGNTLFTIGNGYDWSKTHNALEVRQNGDVYIVDTNDTSTTNYYEKPMIKLQDALGGGGGGSSYTAGDGIDITNDVISVTGKVDTSAITTSITSSSTDAQVPSAKAVNDKLGGLSIVKLTESEYAALVTKDSNTLYCVVPDPSN